MAGACDQVAVNLFPSWRKINKFMQYKNHEKLNKPCIEH
jgi:hypothetical protein